MWFLVQFADSGHSYLEFEKKTKIGTGPVATVAFYNNFLVGTD
jgi:hypothetical protein